VLFRSLPEIAATIRRRSHLAADKVPDDAAPGPRERLARWSTCNQLDAGIPHHTSEALEHRLVGQIPVEVEARVVRTVCREGVLVMVHADHDVEARTLETEADPACATEKVRRRCRERLLGHEAGEVLGRLNREWMRCESNRTPTRDGFPHLARPL
jgi:hypothetical protein